MDYTGECYFGEDTVTSYPNRRSVKCDTLENILVKSAAPSNIDYISLDVEGCEYVTLKNFPFDKYNISLMTIEHNLYRDGDSKKKELFKLLASKGFIRTVEDAPDPRGLPYEDWYINSEFLKYNNTKHENE
jgi:hypothetical protein